MNGSFDLMSLPSIALEKTLRQMHPTDLYKISRTSERCKNFIKSINFNVQLRAYDTKVHVDFAGNQSSKVLKFMPENGRRINEEEWRNTAITEITELFQTSLSALQVKTFFFDETWEWIKEKHNQVKKLDVTVTRRMGFPWDDIRMFLDNAELTQLKDLSIEIIAGYNFKFDNSYIFKNSPETLWIRNASWFYVTNLMDSKVKRCQLDNSHFNDVIINVILKEWKNSNGRLRDLECLSLYHWSQRFNVDWAFETLNFEREMVFDGSTSWRVTCDGNFYLKVSRSNRSILLNKIFF